MNPPVVSKQVRCNANAASFFGHQKLLEVLFIDAQVMVLAS